MGNGGGMGCGLWGEEVWVMGGGGVGNVGDAWVVVVVGKENMTSEIEGVWKEIVRDNVGFILASVTKYTLRG